MTMTTATLSRGGHDGVVSREDLAAKPPRRRFSASTVRRVEIGEAGGDPVSGLVVVADLLLGGWCLSRRSRFAIHAWI